MLSHNLQVDTKSAGVLVKINKPISIFVVREQVTKSLDNYNSQVVIRQSAELGIEITCSCKYFWSFRLFCQHCFAVMNLLQIRKLGAIQLFKRWTKSYDSDEILENDDNKIDLLD